MSSNLFFLSNGKAIEMNEHIYDEEAILQKIIEDNPNLLLRNNDSDDAKLFLIEREFSILENEDSGNSFSLDHLLIDQNGIPVLVEVKRCSDTRIRREVTAQMLDYASRLSAFDISKLRQSFEKNNPSEEIQALYDTDDFWERVATCLKAEKMKLIFAADHIPDSLKTLIEFMDRSMPNIEVYGVELRQYKTANATLLTSSIIGNSVENKQPRPSGIQWSMDSFSKVLLDNRCQHIVPVLQSIISFSKEIGLACSFGRGAKNPSFSIKQGSLTLFRAVAWPHRKDGFQAAIEICLPELLANLDNGWNIDNLRDFLTQFPECERNQSSIVRNTDQFVYINLEGFDKPDNMMAFRDTISRLCNLISDKQNIRANI